MQVSAMRQLYELQELDLETDRGKAGLTSVQAQLHDESALARAKANAAQLEETVKQVKKQQGIQELEIKQWQEKKQELERRLYGGSIRNPKEMESVQAEFQHATSKAQELEDLLLSLMVGLEEKEAALGKATTALFDAEMVRKETVNTLSKEEASLSARLAELSAVRQQKASEIPPAILATYERIRKTTNGRAMAKVERGMCSGCRLSLPTTDVQRVRASQEPVICSSCGRLLYAG